jgi:hypothetical protein
MNRKSLLFTHLFLLSIFLLGSMGANKLVSANPPATVSLLPSFLRTLIFQSFTLNLSIFNVTDVYLWVTTVEWNSTALNLTAYSEGPFLKQGGQTTFMAGKVAPGKVEGLTCSLRGSIPGVSGNGTLATLQFNATGIGTMSVNITFSDLLDSNGASIPHDVTNSTVSVSIPIHDVAVTKVSNSKFGCSPMPVVGQNCTVRVNVTVANQGDFTETFNVTTHANSTMIGSQNVTLASANSTVVTLTWNTTGFTKGNYTISGTADAVPADANTTNNNMTDGTVLVTFIGDVNGDRKVRVDDVLDVASRFGTNYGGPANSLGFYYSANCDINDDLKIRVDDVLATATHFGQGPW